MILPKLPWFLVGPIAAVFRDLAGRVFDKIEAQANLTLQSASVEHSTNTGFQIQKSDLVIRPPAGSSVALQRIFVQYYREILSKNATGPGIDLVVQVFGLSFYRRAPMRDSPLAVFYPWATVRLWVPPLNTALFAQVDEFFGLMLPARCVMLRQVLQSDLVGGFGVAPFGCLY